MGLDYYQILGVQRNASVDEIKRAYRRLALIWHPDKNAENRQEAEVKFKLISEAYEVLRDPSKRTIFDRFGEEGLRQGPTSNPTNSNFTGASSSFGRFHDPNEVFREFFGTSSIFDLFERMNNNANTGFGGGGFRDPFFDDPFFSSVGIGSSAGGGAGMTRSNFGMSNPFFPDFFSGDQGQGHRIGMRSSQKSIEIVNGQRTVTTITTDEQGNQTITRELPDGRVETSSSNISTKSEPKRIK